MDRRKNHLKKFYLYKKLLKYGRQRQIVELKQQQNIWWFYGATDKLWSLIIQECVDIMNHPNVHL